MALRAAQFDQAAATDRGVDIHVCSVDIRVDVRPGRVFNGAVACGGAGVHACAEPLGPAVFERSKEAPWGRRPPCVEPQQI